MACWFNKSVFVHSCLPVYGHACVCVCCTAGSLVDRWAGSTSLPKSRSLTNVPSTSPPPSIPLAPPPCCLPPHLVSCCCFFCFFLNLPSQSGGTYAAMYLPPLSGLRRNCPTKTLQITATKWTFMNSPATKMISNCCFYFLSDVHLLEEIKKETTADFCMFVFRRRREMNSTSVCAHRRPAQHFLSTCFIRHHSDDGDVRKSRWIHFPSIQLLCRSGEHTQCHPTSLSISPYDHVSVCVCVTGYRARALCPSLHLLKPPRLDQGHSSPLF